MASAEEAIGNGDGIVEKYKNIPCYRFDCILSGCNRGGLVSNDPISARIVGELRNVEFPRAIRFQRCDLNGYEKISLQHVNNYRQGLLITSVIEAPSIDCTHV